MSEPESYDLWLLRAQREDETPANQEASRRACLAAVGALLRVDASGAQQILAQLPRLLARNVRASSAHKLLDQLSRAGAVAHLCPVGQTPRFDELSKQAPRKLATTRKPRVTPKATDALVDAARAAHDAAMAHFPKGDAAIDFSPRSAAAAPPVPRPIRHSAGRVAALLAASIALLGAAGALYWTNVAREELELAEASSVPLSVEPSSTSAQAAAATAPPPTNEEARTAILDQLAEQAKQPAFAELSTTLARALERDAKPLRVNGQVIGALIDARASSLRSQLDSLQEVAASGGAQLFVHQRDAQVGFDRLALVPTRDAASLAEVFQTSGPGVSAAEIAAWLRALNAERPFRLVALAERFAEGRFETPTRDAETLAKPIYDCPGATPAAASGAASATAQSVGVLDAKHRGERFNCAWASR